MTLHDLTSVWCNDILLNRNKLGLTKSNCMDVVSFSITCTVVWGLKPNSFLEYLFSKNFFKTIKRFRGSLQKPNYDCTWFGLLTFWIGVDVFGFRFDASDVIVIEEFDEFSLILILKVDAEKQKHLNEHLRFKNALFQS